MKPPPAIAIWMKENRHLFEKLPNKVEENFNIEYA